MGFQLITCKKNISLKFWKFFLSLLAFRATKTTCDSWRDEEDEEEGESEEMARKEGEGDTDLGSDSESIGDVFDHF